jgi:hypothetical protein
VPLYRQGNLDKAFKFAGDHTAELGARGRRRHGQDDGCLLKLGFCHRKAYVAEVFGQTDEHAKRAKLPASGNTEYRLGVHYHDILGDVRLPLE